MVFKAGETANPRGRPKEPVATTRGLRERLKVMGYDALEMLVEMARAANDERNMLQARVTIFKHVYPALRSVEIKGDIESKYILNVLLDNKKSE